ncbi:MAG: molybdopterin synthase sulfur carrier subunit [Chloroflexi bacterium HGW-Chloroflexi-10]|nr:MAG: molybdopterin synthase sulfur carrier subunit [Chloroflexi bacterium HGW-Chloroflexi-10]
MKVIIPTQLRSYTQATEVQANGNTLAEILKDLDNQFPGIRFRMVNEQDLIREHILVFVNTGSVRSLDVELQPDDVIRIVGALSGG